MRTAIVIVSSASKRYVRVCCSTATVTRNGPRTHYPMFLAGTLGVPYSLPRAALEAPNKNARGGNRVRRSFYISFTGDVHTSPYTGPSCKSLIVCISIASSLTNPSSPPLPTYNFGDWSRHVFVVHCVSRSISRPTTEDWTANDDDRTWFRTSRKPLPYRTLCYYNIYNIPKTKGPKSWPFNLTPLLPPAPTLPLTRVIKLPPDVFIIYIYI
jgi:hypothetical protein